MYTDNKVKLIPSPFAIWNICENPKIIFFHEPGEGTKEDRKHGRIEKVTNQQCPAGSGLPEEKIQNAKEKKNCEKQ